MYRIIDSNSPLYTNESLHAPITQRYYQKLINNLATVTWFIGHSMALDYEYEKYRECQLRCCVQYQDQYRRPLYGIFYINNSRKDLCFVFDQQIKHSRQLQSLLINSGFYNGNQLIDNRLEFIPL